jgi:cleavage and polyadenylation specificity factor subunit 3
MLSCKIFHFILFKTILYYLLYLFHIFDIIYFNINYVLVKLDCGIHPGLSGFSGLPFFDEIDPSTIDVLLITHFHLDHAAGLPYFTERTSFRGRVFMTHPTKAIFKWLLSDYVKVSNVGANEMLYDEAQLSSCYDKIETVDYHQEMNVDGIKFTAYNAGHVLGAAMFLIEIAGIKVGLHV